MSALDGGMPATSFVQSDGFQAIVVFAATLLLAALVERALTLHGRRLARRLPGVEIRPETGTRLRFLRRLLVAAIVVVGAFIALSSIHALGNVAASLLASSALAAAVVGFAARQTLANLIAGILLAITQPLRIGDEVTFEGETGRVEDVRLSYTYLRTGAGARVVIPNERLAAGVLRNDTIVEPQVATEVSLWLAPDADAARAVETLDAALPGATATIAEVAVEGTRLSVAGPMGDPADRGAREARLRADAYAALRQAGLR